MLRARYLELDAKSTEEPSMEQLRAEKGFFEPFANVVIWVRTQRIFSLTLTL